MIISYYGDGKGKTTAALGLALRASGYDKKILFAQFIKGDFSTGEDKALAKIVGITHKKFGLGYVGILNDKLEPKEHRRAAAKGLKYVLDHLGEYDIVVLDEIFGAVHGGLVESIDVQEIIKRSDKIDLVLTGRPKVEDLLNLSDLVTQMRPIRHPYDHGVPAKPGIDF